MITIKPTKNLTGVTIAGDYNDFYELVDSIYRMTGIDEDYSDHYFGVKNRLLGICYDIRHAYMGDRDVFLEENGMSEETMKWHKIIAPTHNVYYSVNILFPEAIFIAASVPQMYIFSHSYYGMRSKGTSQDYPLPPIPYSDYIRDKANLNVLCAGIWQALGQAIGDEELENVVRLMERTDESYMSYVTHYIDKCNIELIKTDVAKRKDKIRNIAKRIIKKPQGYRNMEYDFKYYAKEYGTTIYEIEDPALEYPEDIEW
ncbi:MAG: DUF6904 family protein [Lentihominibacter sp.]|jgi:hypothetical protein